MTHINNNELTTTKKTSKEIRRAISQSSIFLKEYAHIYKKYSIFFLVYESIMLPLYLILVFFIIYYSVEKQDFWKFSNDFTGYSAIFDFLVLIIVQSFGIISLKLYTLLENRNLCFFLFAFSPFTLNVAPFIYSIIFFLRLNTLTNQNFNDIKNEKQQQTLT